MAIPIVIAFFGPAPHYVARALRSAAAYNERVVMLGDRTNAGYWDEHVDSDRLSLDRLRRFDQVFVKMSDYPDDYERAFWRRPFAVEAWMRREGIEQAFLLDADVVSFADYAAELAPLLTGDRLAALMTLEDQGRDDLATSLHCSYWTRDALADFIAFCIAAYAGDAIRTRLAAKYQRHLEQAEPGGVCEMTLLHLWRERQPEHICNLAQVSNGMTADLALSTAANARANEYEMRGGFKRLEFHDGRPFGFNRRLNRPVRFLNVHCQGEHKPLMRLIQTPYTRRFFPELNRAQRVAIGVWALIANLL